MDAFNLRKDPQPNVAAGVISGRGVKNEIKMLGERLCGSCDDWIRVTVSWTCDQSLFDQLSAGMLLRGEYVFLGFYGPRTQLS